MKLNATSSDRSMIRNDSQSKSKLPKTLLLSISQDRFFVLLENVAQRSAKLGGSCALCNNYNGAGPTFDIAQDIFSAIGIMYCFKSSPSMTIAAGLIGDAS